MAKQTKMQVREDQQRALNRRNGNPDRGSENWPSKVLHDRGPAPKEGLDEARLVRLADFIETLEVMDTSHPAWADGPVAVLNGLHGKQECLGYLLAATGHGLGAVCFREGQPDAYYLTGYGLVCWGWGTVNGMASVAANGFQNALQDVFTAEPVRRHQIPDLTLADVTSAHVADALRKFVECRDPHRAWWHASGLQPEAAEPDPAPAPKVVALPGAGLTGREQWKGLLLAEDYEALVTLCEGQVARLEADLATWRKRLAAAQALAD